MKIIHPFFILILSQILKRFGGWNTVKYGYLFLFYIKKKNNNNKYMTDKSSNSHISKTTSVVCSLIVLQIHKVNDQFLSYDI